MMRSVFDFCLPRECPACRVGHELKHDFCRECGEEMLRIEQAARCEMCSMPLTLPGAPCAGCLGKGLPLFESVVSLGILKDALQSTIHRMKYERRWALAERLTDRLLHRDDVQQMLDDADILLPVPLHPKRQRERGYNQAEVIARKLSRGKRRNSLPKNLFDHSQLRVAYVARRIRLTETQTHMQSRAQREQNLRDAFELTDARPIKGKRLILVDDVMTTGSTLLSLARTLKPAGPASLCAIVLAVADPRGRSFEQI